MYPKGGTWHERVRHASVRLAIETQLKYEKPLVHPRVALGTPAPGFGLTIDALEGRTWHLTFPFTVEVHSKIKKNDLVRFIKFAIYFPEVTLLGSLAHKYNCLEGKWLLFGGPDEVSLSLRVRNRQTLDS